MQRRVAETIPFSISITMHTHATRFSRSHFHTIFSAISFSQTLGAIAPLAWKTRSTTRRRPIRRACVRVYFSCILFNQIRRVQKPTDVPRKTLNCTASATRFVRLTLSTTFACAWFFIILYLSRISENRHSSDIATAAAAAWHHHGLVWMENCMKAQLITSVHYMNRLTGYSYNTIYDTPWKCRIREKKKPQPYGIVGFPDATALVQVLCSSLCVV